MTKEPQAPEFTSIDDAEWWITIARRNMAFRFGPYSGLEMGEILTRASNESIPLYITANCGRDFDWSLARDFGLGETADWRPMDEAPKDNVILIGDVNGISTKIIWWGPWECWRGLAEDGKTAGAPVHPTAWREVMPEDEQT